MRIHFWCQDGTKLGVDNANIDKLEAQCWVRAKREGKVPTKPLVYEIVSDVHKVDEPQNNDTNKREWIQLKFNFN